ncbi:hypothetical protein KC19_4G223300 [Ceratodon purpureus]|uniref:Uncharacterized protein n=1 Tax=Ceratodon purpureus TaxID=3225 RepID=A0A8T0IBH2_CERPU|nr:hypothetical protein KC19_4G223300 [Ceratodon purpureus]
MNWRVTNDNNTGFELSLSLYASLMNLEDKYISRDKVDLTTKKFCGNETELSILRLKPNRFDYVPRQQLDCPYMVNALLTTKPLKQEIISGSDVTVGSTNWNDPRASFFESPSLQNQKFLYFNTIRRLLAYEREQFTVMNSMPPLEGDNSTYRKMFLTGMTELWLYALDRFGANSSSTDLQYFQTAASRTAATFYEIERFYPDTFALWLYEGNSFLGMDVNWMEYYNTCRPAFCDVTTKNTVFHRTYTALALVGGLWGVAVGVSTVIIWPMLAFLLVRFSKFLSWMRQRLRKKSNEVVHTAVMVYKLNV